MSIAKKEKSRMEREGTGETHDLSEKQWGPFGQSRPASAGDIPPWREIPSRSIEIAAAGSIK